MKPESRLSRWVELLLVVVFGASLALSVLNPQFYVLAWIAFVPLLIATETTSALRTYCLVLIGGTTVFTLGMYWIVDFVMISKGFSQSTSILFSFVVWLYCAHMLAFMIMLFNWLKARSLVHEIILFPVVLVVFTSWFPMLFSLQLAETQIHFLPALQAIEFTGAQSLDAVIALVNVMIYWVCRQLYRHRKPHSIRAWIPIAIGLFLVCVWFVFGTVRTAGWDNELAQWRTLNVGLVQPNEIPKLGKRPIYAGYGDAYPPEMEMTERLSSAGADVVIWPESQVKNYLNHPSVRRAYQHNVRRLGVSLIFQDTQRIRDSNDGKIARQYNSALMLDSRGEQSQVYRKMKLIPFGEYLPFVSDNSFLGSGVRRFFGDFLSELSAGQQHHVFGHEQVNFVPLICYETTFSRFVARAVANTLSASNTKGGVLLGLSNDGWFGNTHQPYIHIRGSILRAVENRLPLIHVANNGPSVVVSPSGKVLFETPFRHAGGFLAEVPYSQAAKGSFYSKYTYLFDCVVLLIFFFCMINGLHHSLRASRRAQ